MTGVTHGADVDRLREVAAVIRGQGQRVQEVGDELGPLSAMLEESWGGPDAEALLVQVHRLRPSIAGAGATLVAWADGLSAQADQQAAGSGEGRGGAGAARGDVRDGVRALSGIVGKVGAPRSGGGPDGWGGGLPLTNAIGDTPSEDPGMVLPSGSVSTSSTAEAGPYKVTETATVTVSGESVDAEGRSVQTTEVTLSKEGAIELSKEIGGYGVSGTGYTGGTIGYSVTAPVGVDPRSIDPMAPETWPEGVSVRFDESFYAGYGMEATYKGLIVGMGQETGAGHYVEISKGAGDKVTVLVGDDKFSSASAEVGIGTDKINAKVGADNGISSGTAREIVIDRSTPEGQKTFESIVLRGGDVPAVGTAGVVDVADLTVMNAHSGVSVSGTAGDNSVGGTLSEWSAGGVQRTHADGTTTLDWTGESRGMQVGGTTTFDSTGKAMTEDSTYYMRLEGVSPEAAQQYNNFYLAEDVKPSGEHNVVISLDHHDLETMRVQAAQTTAAQINAHPEDYPDFPRGDGPVTSSDILAHVDGNPDGARDVVSPFTNGTATETILTAQTDQEILRSMMATEGPLAYQQQIAVDHHSATGQTAIPVGEVSSQRSA